MSRDELLRFFERRQRLLLSRELPRLAGDYSAEAEVVSPFGGTQVGPLAALRTIETFFKALDVRHMVFDAPVIDGDRAVQIVHMDGVHAGAEFMGLPPDGKPFSFTVAFVYEFRDGKIAHEQRIYDFTGLLVQLGVLKARPA
jgi:predicted ester cyclase